MDKKLLKILLNSWGNLTIMDQAKIVGLVLEAEKQALRQKIKESLKIIHNTPPDDPERDQTGGTGSGHRNAARSTARRLDR